MVVEGLVFPVPRIRGRSPVVTQGFNLGTHDGVDLGWVWKAGDPVDAFHRSKRGEGAYVTLAGAPMFSPSEGLVLYSEDRKRGWATRIRTTHGVDVCLFHGMVGTGALKAHQRVKPAEYVVQVGADPTDGEGWAHCHFEIRVPCKSGTEGRDGWGCIPIDPWPSLRLATLLDWL